MAGNLGKAPLAQTCRAQPGDRVGALSHTDRDAAYAFGFGVYEGAKIPDRGILSELGIASPSILLDCGGRVYGFECWWGPEEKVRSIIGGRRVELVPVPGSAPAGGGA